MNYKCIIKKNLLHNLAVIKSLTDSKICAVVKADAYGHGLEKIAKILYDKVDFFAVANLTEALKIKEYINAKILILGECENIEIAINNNISISVFDEKIIKKCEKIAKKLKKTAFLHIKINSGFNRLGFNDIKEFKNILKYFNNKHIIFEGIYTHFSMVNKSDFYYKKQLINFKKYLEIIPVIFNPIIHVGGSNILLKYCDFDMLRIGIFLFGYGMKNLKPVMKIYAKVIAIQNVKKCQRIGYDKNNIAEQNFIIAILNIGYADGLPRNLTKLKIRIGKNYYSLAGKICMDMLMLKVDENVKVGEFVEILGDAEKLAKLNNSISHEILTNFCKFRGKTIVK